MAQAFGIVIIFDVVISHKAGADAVEAVRAVRVDEMGNFSPICPFPAHRHISNALFLLLTFRSDRNVEIGGFEVIQAWTKFEYKGRGGQYSQFVWNKDHFSGVDYDDSTKEIGSIRRFEGKQWADADLERGNFDYL